MAGRRGQIPSPASLHSAGAPRTHSPLAVQATGCCHYQLRRACWEPPALPGAPGQTARGRGASVPAMPMPGRGHPGMPRAEKTHKGRLHERPPLTTHLLRKRGTWTLPVLPVATVLTLLPAASPGPPRTPVLKSARSNGALLLHTPLPKTTHFFFSLGASSRLCVQPVHSGAKLSLMTG